MNTDKQSETKSMKMTYHDDLLVRVCPDPFLAVFICGSHAFQRETHTAAPQNRKNNTLI
jgi:hypothetical protein